MPHASADRPWLRIAGCVRPRPSLPPLSSSASSQASWRAEVWDLPAPSLRPRRACHRRCRPCRRSPPTPARTVPPSSISPPPRAPPFRSAPTAASSTGFPPTRAAPPRSAASDGRPFEAGRRRHFTAPARSSDRLNFPAMTSSSLRATRQGAAPSSSCPRRAAPPRSSRPSRRGPPSTPSVSQSTIRPFTGLPTTAAHRLGTPSGRAAATVARRGALVESRSPLTRA